MGKTRRESMSQRQFALELRAAIDFYTANPTPDRYAKVVNLIEQNPRSVTASHVTHNLGEQRLNWLRGRGLLT